jgi:hypothetical protein
MIRPRFRTRYKDQAVPEQAPGEYRRYSMVVAVIASRSTVQGEKAEVTPQYICRVAWVIRNVPNGKKNRRRTSDVALGCSRVYFGMG